MVHALQCREARPTRVGWPPFALAIRDAQVRAAFRAQARAVCTAEWLHRYSRLAILPERLPNVDRVIKRDHEALRVRFLRRQALPRQQVNLLRINFLEAHPLAIRERCQAAAAVRLDKHLRLAFHQHPPGDPGQAHVAAVHRGLRIQPVATGGANLLAQELGNVEQHGMGTPSREMLPVKPNPAGPQSLPFHNRSPTVTIAPIWPPAPRRTPTAHRAGDTLSARVSHPVAHQDRHRLTQITDVRTLQEIDDEVASLRASLDDTERRLRGDEDLAAAREAFATADAEVAALRREQRRLEGEVADLTARIGPEEKRLYGGSVRNPKELANIQHELELLTAQRAKLEDQLLDLLSTLETADARRKQAVRALAAHESRWESEQAQLRSEASRLAAALADSEARRATQQARLNPTTLRTYEEVRRRRGAVAVARVVGGACGGCRVAIPETVRRRAFTADQIAQCPNCERILYVG